MSGTVLVTGATGNVGSQVVKQLVARGVRVRAAVRQAGKADTIKGSGVDLVELDFDQPESLRSVFQGVEKVFLLTPFVANMVELGNRAVEAARKAGVQLLVRMSALGADAEPGIQLGRWHREVENAIESSRIPFTILRPNSFMQNYSTMLSGTIRSQNSFYLPMGEGTISLIDTRDIAAVAVEALTQVGYDCVAYDLTGPEALSNGEIAELLSKVTGRKIHYLSIPDEDARKGMKQGGMPDWAIDALMELYALNRAGRTAAVMPSVQQVTGRKPITFAQFAQDHADAFKPISTSTSH